jgi:hypothetical protein
MTALASPTRCCPRIRRFFRSSHAPVAVRPVVAELRRVQVVHKELDGLGKQQLRVRSVGLAQVPATSTNNNNNNNKEQDTRRYFVRFGRVLCFF